MQDELNLISKRLERERSARRQAEHIAEEKSRALFLKGQALEAALQKEQATRQELELLLSTLEVFTAKLEPMIIMHALHQYLNRFIESQITSLYIPTDGGIQVTRFHDKHPDQAQSTIETIKEPFMNWKNFPGFDKPSVLDRQSINQLPDELIKLEEETTCLMILPMNSNGQTIGYLVAENQQPDAFFADQIRPSLALLNQTSVALENARLFQRVEKLSTTDPLTGARNRRGFEGEARRHLDIAVRYEKKLSVLMLDIDFFKRVNDTYGHSVGDQVLIAITETMRESCRASDMLTRLGGEEFCLFLPETSAKEAKVLGERIRVGVSKLVFETESSRLSVTISIGVAQCNWSGDTLENLLDRGDQALYKAKQTGRDRVVVWVDSPNPTNSMS